MDPMAPNMTDIVDMWNHNMCPAVHPCAYIPCPSTTTFKFLEFLEDYSITLLFMCLLKNIFYEWINRDWKKAHAGIRERYMKATRTSGLDRRTY